MRKNVIRGLIKAYRDPHTSEGNKKELKKALISEFSLITSEPEELVSDYLLNDWMDNEMRTELEENLREEFGLAEPKVDEEGQIVFRLPKLPKK